ncbi:hypothetical protein [Paenibacillus sp. L3-i20]|uniref:hypothetical protein n=1 Tax=Paenibacillus sp. L3-i20 TaxID=2905833 RepID=UPI001EE089E9|nr:hypothetical protein [Paenibacillus sp. L3-i20]GKU76558.1 hypothetical protein L3i20_v209550 [Paenibacillus sp. L3-i20]
MTIDQNYRNDMNEINVSSELKQTLISIPHRSTAEKQSTVSIFHRKLTMITVSCLMISLLALGGTLALQHTKTTNTITLFSGFAITAYAADGTTLQVNPDIEFPLGQYSMIMSNAPGFPITIAAEGADLIELQASDGQLLNWNHSDSKIIVLGKEVTVKSGDTIYWSPLAEGSASQAAAIKSELEITAYKNKTKLGNSRIEITSDDNGMYSGKLSN